MTSPSKKEEARERAAKALSVCRKRLTSCLKHLMESGNIDHAKNLGDAIKAIEAVIDAVGEPVAKAKAPKPAPKQAK